MSREDFGQAGVKKERTDGLREKWVMTARQESFGWRRVGCDYMYYHERLIRHTLHPSLGKIMTAGLLYCPRAIKRGGGTR